MSSVERLFQDDVEQALHPQRNHTRPSLPFVLLPTVILWLSLVLAESVAWRVFVKGGTLGMVIPLFFATCGVAVTFSSLIRPFQSRKAVSLMLVSAGIGFVSFALGLVFWMSWQKDAQTVDSIPGGVRKVEIVSDARTTVFGQTSDGILLMENGSRLRVVVSWGKTDVAVSGNTVECYGNLTPTRSTESSRRRHREAMVGSLNVTRVVSTAATLSPRGLVAPFRSQAKELIESGPGDGSALMEGLLLGDRSALSGSDVEQAFRVCGLSHLIAVSGSHLAVVSALALLVLRRIKVNSKAQALLLVVLLSLYAAISGFQVSALRALLMTGVSLSAIIFGRRRYPLGACCLCVMALLILDPSSAFSLSLLLSSLAVAGILLFNGLISDWLRLFARWRFRSIRNTAALTLSASIVTLPVTVPLFALVPVLSPLANILFAPLISLLLVLGLVAAPISCLLSGVPGSMLMSVVTSIADPICWLVCLFSKIPGVSVAASWNQALSAIIAIVAVASIWIFWPRPSRRALAFAISCSLVVALIATVVAAVPKRSRIIMLDVGQGDSFVLQSKEATVLVDTGNVDALLLSGLAAHGINHLDAILITHLDDDHCGSIDALKGTIDVDRILFTQPTFALEDRPTEGVEAALEVVGENGVGSVETGDVIDVGSFRLRVVSPKMFTEDGGNADSLCFALSCDEDQDGVVDATALFVGDAESDTLERLQQEGSIGQVDILKVGHHGSAASLDEKTLSKLDPRVALVSVGKDNRYGHPAEKTLDLLQQHGVHVYRTDRNQCVTVTVTSGGYKVVCDTI